MKRTRLRPVSPKRRSRVGKLGIVRLVGKDMDALRLARYEMDNQRCVDCGRWVRWERGYPDSMELSHQKGKRNHGDTLENTRTRCHECHDKHDGRNMKAVPAKEKHGIHD
ncbi:MAG TPA: hypothetical protein VLC51_04615 [Nitrospira sp.]|nr:hypothetical protein [Nitrospira sp.]